MKYAALCCIAKDEDVFLKEWLAYHAVLGFEYFIIYDNCSTVPIAELLGSWAGGVVTVIRNHQEKTQRQVYNNCLEIFGADFRWIAFCDLDEYIALDKQDDIRIFLAEYESYASVGLNWRMFSSSGHIERPKGLVLENYLDYLKDDVHIKSIVQPALVTECANPHAFTNIKGAHSSSTRHVPIPSGFPFSAPNAEHARINHYYYKSAACFQHKIARGNPCNIGRNMQGFEEHLKHATKRDEGLLRFAPQVQASLNSSIIHTRAFIDTKESTEDMLLSIQILLEHKNFAEAELCLAYAGLTQEESLKVMVYNFRALAARKQQNFELSEYYLRQSMLLGATNQCYIEYAALYMETGRQIEAKQMLEILKIYGYC